MLTRSSGLPRFNSSTHLRVAMAGFILSSVWTGNGSPTAQAEPPTVMVGILSGPQVAYRTSSNALHAALEAKAEQAAINATLADLAHLRPTLIAAAGDTAADLALKTIREVPVVYFMLLNACDARFVARPSEFGNRTAGLAMEVSPEAKLSWILNLRPQCRKIAILCSTGTVQTATLLQKVALEDQQAPAPATQPITARAEVRQKLPRKPGQPLEVVRIQARTDAFGEALEKLSVSRCDAVLMLPDPRVYNSASVKELILWGLRQKTPVFTFSTNIVEAGALAGEWVEPQVNGADAADVIRQILQGTAPSKLGLGYSAKSQKAINRNTAERLGIDIRVWNDKGVKIVGNGS